MKMDQTSSNPIMSNDPSPNDSQETLEKKYKMLLGGKDLIFPDDESETT